ncbi:MAG: hypothetical protein M3246_09400 [Actinomycetota bacterium]|nr:hypothetical protein [Actinomycetota bacterium]
MEAYRNAGAKHATIADLQVAELDSANVIATVRWNALSEDGVLLRAFTVSYQMLQAPDGWRILSYTYHDERAGLTKSNLGWPSGDTQPQRLHALKLSERLEVVLLARVRVDEKLSIAGIFLPVLTGAAARLLPRPRKCSPNVATEDRGFQAVMKTGATGLEPATSGVTGRVGHGDD